MLWNKNQATHGRFLFLFLSNRVDFSVILGSNGGGERFGGKI